MLVPRLVKLTDLLLLPDRDMEARRPQDKEFMEEEAIHPAALDRVWIHRSSSGSMLWIKTEADKSTSRSSSALS